MALAARMQAGAHAFALNGVPLKIVNGEILVITGLSGFGESTIVRTSPSARANR